MQVEHSVISRTPPWLLPWLSPCSEHKQTHSHSVKVYDGVYHGFVFASGENETSDGYDDMPMSE